MLEKIELSDICDIAKKAGDAIMEVYEKSFAVEYKEDDSPLTEADKNANAVICEALSLLYPHIPIISEENTEIPYEKRKDFEYFWLIDPLDGTKEFVKKNGEFTVNIALIHKNRPVLGVVYAPVLGTLYSAKEGEGAFKDAKTIPQKREDDSYVIVASKSHLNEETKAYIDSIQTDKKKVFKSIGSSLKLCLVAEGAADIYPRLFPTMEWDTAAAHAIVNVCGKKVFRYGSRDELSYNKKETINPFFIVK